MSKVFTKPSGGKESKPLFNLMTDILPNMAVESVSQGNEKDR